MVSALKVPGGADGELVHVDIGALRPEERQGRVHVAQARQRQLAGALGKRRRP